MSIVNTCTVRADQRIFGAAMTAGVFLDYFQGRTPTRRAFTSAEKKIYLEIQHAADRITQLVTQKSLPARVPLAEAPLVQDLLKL